MIDRREQITKVLQDAARDERKATTAYVVERVAVSRMTALKYLRAMEGESAVLAALGESSGGRPPVVWQLAPNREGGQ